MTAAAASTLEKFAKKQLDVSIPCDVCGKPMSGKYTVADDKKMHNWCLKCTKCNEIIDTEEYVSDGDAFFHARCVAAEHGMCGKCNKAIAGSFLTHDDKNFHQECFSLGTCPACAAEVRAGAVVTVGDDNWHSECWEKKGATTTLTSASGGGGGGGGGGGESDAAAANADVCTACATKIEGKLVRDSRARAWCPGCFKCTTCSTVITGSFGYVDTAPVCSSCIDKEPVRYADTSDAPACTECSKPCVAAVANLDGKPYHPECVVCQKCKTPLAGSFMMGPKGERWCEKCANDAAKA